VDVRGSREGRVHEHDARAYGRVEMVVDVRGVEPGDAVTGKQTIEQIGAGLGDLVQDQASAGKLSVNGEEPVPAEGSNTTSAGGVAAAVPGTKPSPIGVENC